MRTLRRTWLPACCAAAATLLPLLVLPTSASAAPPARGARPVLDLTTVSSRPDAVTGGDALVRVDVPSGVTPGAVHVQRNGSDVTRGFRVVDGDLLGLVEGLVPGSHRLTATAPRARTATLAVQAHPGTGPLFSGPQEQPFACETTEYRTPAGAQVGEPLDEDCSIATRVEYLYRTTDTTSRTAFKPLPEDPRPADLATTTTLDDRTVPYIVRVQIGTVNRGIYEMATLHDPTRPAPTVFSPSPGWNGRLVYTFGGGCRSGWYQQGSGTGGVLVDSMLSRGFAVASNTLNVFGNNCSDLLTSETLAMTREEFIESYGPPLHTMGWGCSGGSYQSHQAADAYPGLLDGIVVGCSFPNVGFATSQMLADTRLLHEWFRSGEQGAASFTQEQQLAVSGFGEHPSIASQSAGAARLDPDAEFDASTPPGERYAASNPTGARATVWDHTRNAYGVDPATGFARRPLDNVGVQYGLEALRAGSITLGQFLDLNEGIGGLDVDAEVQDERMAADPQARRAAYETGRILDGGGGLATTPIIDHRAYTDLLGVGDIHQRYHSFSTRERLVEANGDADNQVMLVRDNSYGLFSAADPVLVYALEQMDRWILEVQASGADTHREVADARPESLEDSCWEPGRLDTAEEFAAKRIVEQIRPDAGRCQELYPTFASPRIVAGGPLASDVITCRTTQPRRRAYPAMRDADWQRLLALFPNGVCTYDRPGVDEQPMRGTWATFSAPGSWTFLEPRRVRAQR